MDSSTRREFLRQSGSIAASLAATAAVDATPTAAETGDIAALLPRDKTGRHFILYADCCSGVAGAPNEKSHAAVNAIVARVRPRPEFIAFPGDAVMGYITDTEALRKQWEHWWNVEMAWLKKTAIPLYQSTSNHNTYDAGSEQVFREFHPHLPQNGPADQKGLAYFIRLGDLLYVSTHQPDRTRPYRREMRIETEWLDAVLREHADARFKFVAGHYPVFPVNGYTQYPLWCFRPEERQPFWDVLVRHRVNAYLGSHILAFDVQSHDGILQIVSGGAGTMGAGPLAMMPSRSEYLHAIQMAVDDVGLRYRVLNCDGKPHESLAWPFALPELPNWKRLVKTDLAATLAPQGMPGSIVAWRFQGRLAKAISAAPPQTLLCGCDSMEGVATVWIGLEGTPQRLVVRLVPQSGFGWQTWTGPEVADDRSFDFQIALHSGMGPGGVLFRTSESTPWQSVTSTSSKGTEELTWPRTWTIGEAQSGPNDWPFRGSELAVHFVRVPAPQVV
jgi:Calcineurin-like phosphoesterase